MEDARSETTRRSHSQTATASSDSPAENIFSVIYSDNQIGIPDRITEVTRCEQMSGGPFGSHGLVSEIKFEHDFCLQVPLSSNLIKLCTNF